MALAEVEILVQLSEAPHRRLRMPSSPSGGSSRSRITHTVGRMEEAPGVPGGLLDDGRGVLSC